MTRKKDTLTLPKFYEPDYDENGIRLFHYDDEPKTLPLLRHRETPSQVSTSYRLTCCECGYTHTFLFYVWQSTRPGLALAIQAVSHEATRLGRRGLKIVKATKRRRK